jgi:hypothetical protein
MNINLGPITDVFRSADDILRYAADEARDAARALEQESEGIVRDAFHTVKPAANTLHQASNSLRNAATTFGKFADDLPGSAVDAVAGTSTVSDVVRDIESALHDARSAVRGRVTDEIKKSITDALRPIESTIPRVRDAMNTIRTASEGIDCRIPLSRKEVPVIC